MENFKSIDEQQLTDSEKELVEFVTTHCDRWRDYRDNNYLQDWDEYERLYYGVWADQDKTRDAERSRIVTPAIRQAVDNKVAELLEGISGNGKYFDINDDMMDQQGSQDVELVKNQLHEDLKKDRFDKEVQKAIKIGEIFGTSVAEILVKTQVETVPSMQAVPQGGAMAVGVTESERVSVPIRTVHPRNLLIDPNSESIEDAMGVAIEEYTSLHKVVKGIEAGIYRKVQIEPYYDDTDLEPTQQDSVYQDDKVRILRYYGLVPREYLEMLENEGGEVVDLFKEDSAADRVSDLVEAIIVIANGSKLLKAEASPYMMKDRPLVAYRPETVPGLFWGVGTVQKGYNMQKAIDAQMRSHLDSLALSTAPMMGMDATRLPRGMKFEVRPGKSILTNGNPAEVLFPFKFGALDPANYETAKGFEAMLLQATGTIDSAELTRAAASSQGAGGVGMSLAMSAIVKKNKQALTNFQEDFLVPMIKKVAYRYMQFDPERYPSQDFKFIPLASLGMVAKEYEQQQFIGLLQTLGPQSPVVPLILQGIVESSSLPNKESLSTALQQMTQPDPQQQQLAQAQQQAQIQLLQAQIAQLQGQAMESQADAQEAQARAQKLLTEAQLLPEQTRIELIKGLSANMVDPTEQEFERRAKVAELLLKERDIDVREKIVNKQMQ
jgi:hypothetical protein